MLTALAPSWRAWRQQGWGAQGGDDCLGTSARFSLGDLHTHAPQPARREQLGSPGSAACFLLPHFAPWWRGGPGGICAGSCRWWEAGVRAVQPPGWVGGDGRTDLPVPSAGLGAGGDRLAWTQPGGPSGWRDMAADGAWGQAPSELPGACLRLGLGCPSPQRRPRAAVAISRPVPFPPCLMAHSCCRGVGRGPPRERMTGV